MRQIGSIETRAHAILFIDYLVSQNISAHAEEEFDGWAIWVRDENSLEMAVDELEWFTENPADPLYQRASADALARRREMHQRRLNTQKNLINMRGQWQKGLSRHTPFVFVLIFACVAVTMLNNMQRGISSGSRAWSLTFMSEESFEDQYHTVTREVTDNDLFNHKFFFRRGEPETRQLEAKDSDSLNIFSSILRGQLWRLVTPIFLHLGLTHLVFNLMWVWYFGSVIEDRIKTTRFMLLVLAIAILSNIAQTMFKSPLFGGISGVNYGLFGYLWMKTLFDRTWSFKMPQSTIIIFLVWFLICLTGRVGPIANWGHGIGLVVGVVIGYAPVLSRRIRKKDSNDSSSQRPSRS